MRKDEKPIVIEQTFNASIETVWKAITEINQMRQWYFENIPDFKPEVGFETQFDVKSEDRTFRHLWKVTEVVSKRKITYNWKFDGYPGDSFVTFELFKKDNTTMLRLTVRVTESFPQDIPEFLRKSAVGGWTYFIEERLKIHLKKRQ